jgi:hypothetical protein
MPRALFRGLKVGQISIDTAIDLTEPTARGAWIDAIASSSA